MCLKHMGKKAAGSYCFTSVIAFMCSWEQIHLKQQIKHSVITARVFCLNQCCLHPLHVHGCMAVDVCAHPFVSRRGKSQRAPISPINIQHWFLHRYTPERQVTGATRLPSLSYSLQLSCICKQILCWKIYTLAKVNQCRGEKEPVVNAAIGDREHTHSNRSYFS